MSSIKYRPANGTEGDIFRAEWCDSCALLKDENEEYCQILGSTFMFHTDDPGYPDEWEYDEDGNPCCTEYLHDSEKPMPRCTRTIDMFD